MNRVDSVYIEKWAMIYAVLESATYILSRYKNKEVNWYDTLRLIRLSVAEVFGERLGDEVHNEIAGYASADTVEIIKKIQDILVKRVIEEKR